MEKRRVEFRRLFDERTDVDTNAGRLESLNATTRLRVRIANRDNHSDDSGAKDRVHARWRFPLMRTWLEGHVHGRAAGAPAGRLERFDFRVGSAETPVRSFTHDPSVVHDHRANQRIRRHLPPTQPRQVERASHPRRVVVHGSARARWRYWRLTEDNTATHILTPIQPDETGSGHDFTGDP